MNEQVIDAARRHVAKVDTSQREVGGAPPSDGGPPYLIHTAMLMLRADLPAHAYVYLEQATEQMMKTPAFFFDGEDGMGSRLMGTATDLPKAIENLTAEFQAVLDRLQRGHDGDVLTLRLSRRDMTPEELAELPEE